MRSSPQPGEPQAVRPAGRRSGASGSDIVLKRRSSTASSWDPPGGGFFVIRSMIRGEHLGVAEARVGIGPRVVTVPAMLGPGP